MDTQLFLTPTTNGRRTGLARLIRAVRDWLGTAGLVLVLVAASLILGALERQRSKDATR